MKVKELVENLLKLDQEKRIGRLSIHSSLMQDVKFEDTTCIDSNNWYDANNDKNELVYILHTW